MRPYSCAIQTRQRDKRTTIVGKIAIELPKVSMAPAMNMLWYIWIITQSKEITKTPFDQLLRRINPKVPTVPSPTARPYMILVHKGKFARKSCWTWSKVLGSNIRSEIKAKIPTRFQTNNRITDICIHWGGFNSVFISKI